MLPALRKYGSYGEIQLEELIAKTVTMTVAETIKQLMPIMQSQNNTTCRDILKEDTRARRLKQSKIAQLKPEGIWRRTDLVPASGTDHLALG